MDPNTAPLGELVKRSLDAACRRNRRIMAQLEKWRGQPDWRPDCAGCRKPSGHLVCRDADGPIAVPCPSINSARCPIAVERKANALAAEIAALEAAGIGRLYHSARIECVHPPAMGTVQDYCTSLRSHVFHGKGLIFCGGTGTGKTSALTLIARRAHETRLPFAYCHAGDLSDAFHLTPAPPQLARWRTTPLLLLDEFGAAYGSDFNLARFDAFYEERHAHRRATCIATNLLPKELKSPQWERVYDRLRSSSLLLVLGGKSRREDLTEL